MDQQILFEPGSGHPVGDVSARAFFESPVPCANCGFERFVDVAIHEGRSKRRDCARCGRTLGFPLWYGAALDTRSAAAASIEAHRPIMRCKVLEFVASRGDAGATDEEIAEALQMRESTARARRVDLRDGGQVRDSMKRRQSQSGKLCIVWKATNKPLAG
jgi:hypothetical protein